MRLWGSWIELTEKVYREMKTIAWRGSSMCYFGSHVDP